MLWRKKCVFTGYVKLVIVNVVKEHIDPAQVICGEVDFLSEEALADIVLSQYLCGFQQQ